ncbi:MAG: hypothetical protein AAFQ53_06290, partial [Bacteroidota bacterium]
MSPALDSLIRQRTGGAVNVRGVRLQILYTLHRALRAHASSTEWTVTPEGLEDVDVTVDGIAEHIQVKTSKNRWAPHHMKDALRSIADAAQVSFGDPTRTFAVVLAGECNDDVRAMVTRQRLPPTERSASDVALTKLIRKVGADDSVAAHLAQTLAVRVIAPDALEADLLRDVVEAFDAHPSSASVVVQSLAAFVLDHARSRTPFRGPDLAQAYAAIADGQATACAFEARGRALIAPIDWAPPLSPDAFVDGRGTRPGHVALGLDAVRPLWLDRIGEVLDATRLCIIRAPSGQGKSALAYRYALEQWDADSTLVLQACTTPEGAAQVVDYLRARADLGVPTTLLVDGADWRLQHWPTVAAAARDRGIPVLATCRVEDWRRFAAGSAVDPAAPNQQGAVAGPLADAAIIEPRLDLDEARALFRLTKKHGRLHKSVRSAEDAYEQVDEPALLMEYLYLLTHGELLRHRLRGQIRELQRKGEDAHLAVLRRASFAHACGVPAPVAALLAGSTEDPQRVLSQVDGEYVRLRGRDVDELHRVRSEHLAALLHESAPAPADTAQDLLPLLPDDRLGPFVAGALRYPGVHLDDLLARLVDLSAERGPVVAAAVADGLFESGERDYRDAMADAYRQAEAVMGSPGPFFLSTLLAPNQEPEIFDQLVSTVDTLPNDAADRFRALREIADAAPQHKRGYDRIASLLHDLLPLFPPSALVKSPGPSGRLLQDAHRLGLQPHGIGAVLDHLTPPIPDEVPAFSSLILSLHAFAPELTERWVRQHAPAVGAAAAEHLALVGPPTITNGPNGPAVNVVFYPSDADGAPPLNDQAVSRLQLIRELYPFAVHFRSHAHWLLPEPLVPTHDESIKDMVPKYLRPRLFRDRQGLWNVVGREHEASPTFWAYQEGWHEIRSAALDYGETLEAGIRAFVEGRPFDWGSPAVDRLDARLNRALRSVPQPPAHTSPRLARALKQAGEWESVFSNVVNQVGQFAKTKSPDTGRILRYNAYETLAKLDGLHTAFGALFQQSPDSFDLQSLRDRERRSYAELASAVEFWTDPPAPAPVRSLRKSLREVHARRDEALRTRVEDALLDAGVLTSAPPEVVRERLSQKVVIAIPVEHPCDPEPAILEAALFAIAELGESTATSGRPDELWVALTVGGHRVQHNALRFFSHQLYRLLDAGDLNWESFAPLPPPDDVAQVLRRVAPVCISPLYEAWRAAYAAQFIGAHIESYLELDPDEHPRAIERIPELLERSERETREFATRLGAMVQGTPVPVSADARLIDISESF